MSYQTTIATAEKLAARADVYFANTGQLNADIVCKFINAGYAPVLAVVRLVEKNNYRRPERIMRYVNRALYIMDADPQFMQLERKRQWVKEVTKVERVAEHMTVHYAGGDTEYFHICEHEKLERVYWLDDEQFIHTVTGEDSETWERV